MCLNQFLIDFYIARQHGLVSEDDLARSWQWWQAGHRNERLSRLLVERGCLDPEAAIHLDRVADENQRALTKLCEELTPLESQNRTDRLPNGQVDPKADQYATLVEPHPGDTSISDSMPAVGTGNGNPNHHLGIRYRKERPFAQGGLGQVWIASDLELHRQVALKEIRSAHADEPISRQRFTQEAAITGALEHPGVVPVYGLGSYPDGRPYYAMRFIQGKTLLDAINHLHRNAPKHRYRQRRWVLEFRKLLGSFLDVCNTIEYAHSRNVIHRDIKPNNIMLGDYGETLVVDWGLAKQLGEDDREESAHRSRDQDRISSGSPLIATDSNLTLLGSVVGTPAYMGPEQASGGRLAPVGPQADVYSLGATLFHLLTGDAPRDNVHGVLRVRERLSDIPAPLASICARCTQRELDSRYASARELAGDLDRWLSGDQVHAHRETLFERVHRWIRNHPAIVMSLSVASVLLFLASLLGFLGYSQYRHGIQLERQEKQQLALQHLQQVLSAAESNISSARLELQNGRFETALGFINNAIARYESIDSQSGQPLIEPLTNAREMRDRTQRLIRFYQSADLAQELAFRDSSRRSSVLFQNALREANVFDRLEWWTALPSDDLTPKQIYDLQERVYRAMFLLTALRLKETIPSELNVVEMLKIVSNESNASNQSSIVLFNLLDAFRKSQGAELGRRFAQQRREILSKALSAVAFKEPLVRWKGRNASDLYVMGSALGYMAVNTDQHSRELFATLLGIADAEQASEEMLTKASELQKDEYWTQLVRAYFESQRRQYDASWRSYLHAISLKPDNWVGYAWLGVGQRNYAVQLDEEDPDRRKFISRSARNLERAVDLNPTSHLAHYERGHTLTWLMSDPRESLASYLQALFLQEPLASINDSVIEDVDRFHLRSVRDWCMRQKSTWELPELGECLAWTELILENWQEAEAAALEVLDVRPDSKIAQFVIASTMQKQGKLRDSADCLDRIAERREWFPVLLASGIVAQKMGDLRRANLELQAAKKTAVADWQHLLVQRSIARISLELGDSDAEKQVRSAIEVARTERLDDLVASAQQSPGILSLLDAHHHWQAPITELVSSEPLSRVPLINASFELGIAPGWGDSLEKLDRPAWDRKGGSLAQASVSSAHAQSGKLSLHLEDHSEGTSSSRDTYAELTQTVPTQPLQTYRLEASFYCLAGATASVQLLVDDQVVLSSPPVASRWQPIESRFTAQHEETTFSIRCVGPTDTFVDSLRVTVSEE